MNKFKLTTDKFEFTVELRKKWHVSFIETNKEFPISGNLQFKGSTPVTNLMLALFKIDQL